MFDRLKKAFTKDAKDGFAPSSQLASTQVSEWAGTQGFGFAGMDAGKGFSLTGKVSGKPWRMELGRPSRKPIAQPMCSWMFRNIRGQEQPIRSPRCR